MRLHCHHCSLFDSHLWIDERQQMAFCSLAVREHDHRDCLLRRSHHPLCLVHLCPANPCLCHSLRGATCLRSCLALLVGDRQRCVHQHGSRRDPFNLIQRICLNQRISGLTP